MKELFIEINDNRYRVVCASGWVELARGMSGIDSFDPYSGMLFDFIDSNKAVMTPRGLKITVDLAFIKEDGTITQLTRLDPDLGLTRASTEEVRYALEVPKGFFDNNQIKVGDKVLIEE